MYNLDILAFTIDRDNDFSRIVTSLVLRLIMVCKVVIKIEKQVRRHQKKNNTSRKVKGNNLHFFRFGKKVTFRSDISPNSLSILRRIEARSTPSYSSKY